VNPKAAADKFEDVLNFATDAAAAEAIAAADNGVCDIKLHQLDKLETQVNLKILECVFKNHEIRLTDYIVIM